MITPRQRFYVALGVFALWVASLAALAVTSGRRPPQRASAASSPRD